MFLPPVLLEAQEGDTLAVMARRAIALHCMLREMLPLEAVPLQRLRKRVISSLRCPEISERHDCHGSLHTFT